MTIINPEEEQWAVDEEGVRQGQKEWGWNHQQSISQTVPLQFFNGFSSDLHLVQSHRRRKNAKQMISWVTSDCMSIHKMLQQEQQRRRRKCKYKCVDSSVFRFITFPKLKLENRAKLSPSLLLPCAADKEIRSVEWLLLGTCSGKHYGWWCLLPKRNE